MKLKKLFAGLISLAAALLAVCAITVCAGAETSGDFVYYALDDKTVCLFEYSGSATNLTIPSTLDGKKVTEIRRVAFADCSSLISVTIPDTVTTIGDYAFRGCSSLTSINIPNSVTYMGAYAFSGTPFLDNQTTTVKYAGKWAVDCDSDATTATIKSGTVGITDYTFYYHSNLTSVVIPKGVKRIGSYAFERCNLSSINIPDGVTNIGEYAFAYCSKLSSVTLPDSITRIGDDAFLNTPLLNNQTSDVKYVGKWAVSCEGKREKLQDEKSLSIDSLATYINNDNLNVTIKNGTVGIADNAFYFCENVLSLVLPDGIKYIGSYAFDHCIRLISIKIPDSVKKIEYATFDGCTSLTSVTIPDSVTSIGDWAFSGCSSLTSVTIPDGVKSIGSRAFYWMENLASVTIPESVTNIGDRAFYECSSLKDVYYSSSKPQWDKISIGEYNEDLLNATIHFAKTITAPSSISALKLKARAADALRLTWTKNTTADGYIIEMKSGNTWTRVGKITKNSTVEFKKSKLKAGTAYTFRIKAYTMNGKTALYSGYTTISARTNPSAISGLKLKARAADALRLTWTKNTSADGYIIEMKSGNTWTRVGKITKNSTVEFKKSKLKAGTAYSFRVKAYKMSGKTALYSGYTTISARTNPSAVSGLKLKNANSNAVRLAWTKNTSADGYIIEMKVNGTWTRVGKVTKNSTVEFRKGSLKGKTSYSFRIKAYKMSGKTALYSGYKTITVKTK